MTVRGEESEVRHQERSWPDPAKIDHEKFWARVDRRGDAECWPWTGSRRVTGYGVFYVDGRTHGAHRVSLSIATGSWPGESMVLHACDNPPCVNPKHLRTGNAGDNARDAMERGRLRGGRPAMVPGEIVSSIRGDVRSAIDGLPASAFWQHGHMRWGALRDELLSIAAKHSVSVGYVYGVTRDIRTGMKPSRAGL